MWSCVGPGVTTALGIPMAGTEGWRGGLGIVVGAQCHLFSHQRGTIQCPCPACQGHGSRWLALPMAANSPSFPLPRPAGDLGVAFLSRLLLQLRIHRTIELLGLEVLKDHPLPPSCYGQGRQPLDSSSSLVCLVQSSAGPKSCFNKRRNHVKASSEEPHLGKKKNNKAKRKTITDAATHLYYTRSILESRGDT